MTRKQATRWPDFETRRELRAKAGSERVYYPGKPPFRYSRSERREPSLINSAWFLVPFGLICVGMVLARAWGFV